MSIEWTDAEREAVRRALDHHRHMRFGLPDALLAALAPHVEAMLDRARAEATTATPALVDRLAEAAFVSDDLGGHHKPGPMLRPHTWQSIPEEGRENYRRLIRDVLATLADAHRAGVCDCSSLGACFPTCASRRADRVGGAS